MTAARSPYVLLVSLLLSCGDPRAPRPCPPAPDAFGCVAGATLAHLPGAEFRACTEGLLPRVERAVALAGELWGVEPSSVLTGWVIQFSGGWFVCHAAEGPVWTYGCVIPDDRIIQVAAGWERCLAGVLVHEIGHLVVGDRAHLDPRFGEADALEAVPCRE